MHWQNETRHALQRVWCWHHHQVKLGHACLSCTFRACAFAGKRHRRLIGLQHRGRHSPIAVGAAAATGTRWNAFGVGIIRSGQAMRVCRALFVRAPFQGGAVGDSSATGTDSQSQSPPQQARDGLRLVSASSPGHAMRFVHFSCVRLCREAL